MKGFPNQVAELETLSKALRVLSDLIEEGQNPKDDAVLGEALIRRRVLGTGHTSIPVDKYLAQQKAKKRASDQSYRTRARGLRELFRILGLIDDSAEHLTVTPAGQQISTLAGKKLTPEIIRLWRRVILSMSHDGGDEQSSHPYQVLLRLVARQPGITRAECALALEARNDSESELDRIISLSRLKEQKVLETIGVTKSNWDNAKKILPRFAEQLADVIKIGQQFYLSDAPGVKEQSVQSVAQAKERGPRKPKTSRAVTATTIARLDTESWDEADDPSELILDPKEIQARLAKIQSRRKRHNLIVEKIAKKLETEGGKLFADPFDCLACFEGKGFLIEVKTLDGTQRDEVARVREALGQLLYYESFVTKPLVKESIITKIACFEHRISEPHIEWLQASDILVVWNIGSEFDGTDEAKRGLAGNIDF